MMPHANPGNLHVRLGACLALYESAVFEGDLQKASSVLGIVATYCSVHMDTKQRKRLDAMPGFAYGDGREPHQIFSDMNARLAYILETVKPHGVFSRATLELGDSSTLDEEAEEVAA